MLMAAVLCGLIFAASAAELVEVEKGVYRYEDTANVYAIVRNGRALLIDFGSGEILPHLNQRDITVDWILHTHYHRDQAQGDRMAREKGIRIAVPKSERRYFDAAEHMWQDKKVFVLYDMRNEFFALRQNVAVDHDLEPNTTFRWEGLDVMIAGTPGHTPGSLSFVVELNGKRLAFIGDLMASPGKIHTLHDLEWRYVGPEGIHAEIQSLNLIRQLAPDILLPSHGELTRDVQKVLPSLIAALGTVFDAYNWHTHVIRKPARGPVRLTKHIWESRAKMWGTAYVIVSDSGHAFVWDANLVDVPVIEEIRRQSGFRTLDFITASHYHEDHVSGVNDLKARYGAKFWAMDHMMDVLQRPAAYNLPCLWPKPIGVDRVLKDGEKVEWEGMSLQFFYLPGQTEYGQGLLIEDDGKRILFDGDNIGYPTPGRPVIGHYVARNFQRLDRGHVYASRKLLELKPDFIAPNHYEWVPASDANMQSYLSSAESMRKILSDIIDQPDAMFGVDNNWLSVYPYQSDLEPGQETELQLRYRNWLPHTSTVRARFRLPDGWRIEPAELEISAPARAERSGSLRLRIPADVVKNRRAVITVDAVRDGRRLGEITEALVNIAPMKAH
jgi:glyoxylase-like metal-dependent hydrolase (beta-lactamase superfamily II)